jgi:hypothetical protein
MDEDLKIVLATLLSPVIFIWMIIKYIRQQAGEP